MIQKHPPTHARFTGSAKLIPEYTQFLLEKSFEEYQGAKFLFYNNIGCVIERIEGSTSTLELELHDKSRPKRLTLDAKNRPFCMFALREDILMYATTTLIVFQTEKFLKEGFEAWEFRWEDIQGIAIGGNWLAACSKDELKILDYSGNELHSLCFDRRMVTVEAYEDLLAVVYHGGLPLWGCQSLKVRIYRIGVDAVKLERDTVIPLKPNSFLKWLGFSEEGMLYCQDNLEVLRGYIYERDEWQPVYSLENTSERLFIQHISGLDIYGFKLQQKQGEKIEPRVLPRSLPRRIPMELPSLQINFLTKEHQAYLKKAKLRNMQILHEEYRYKHWYKLKWSRNKSHPWASFSKNISSAEEIKTSKTLHDYQLLEYVKKLTNQSEDKNTKEFEFASRSLMLILERETHLEQTCEAARKLLEIGSKYQRSHLYEDSSVVYSKKNGICHSKINQVNILQKMVHILETV